MRRANNQPDQGLTSAAPPRDREKWVMTLPDQLPEFEISGPSVDDDIRRLIRRHGAENVREAIKRQTAGRRGPNPRRDWPEVRDVLREDARSWLDGRNPFATRSNRSIAREFVAKNRGQSEDATYRRLMRKLSEHRRYYTLIEAASLSEDHYPHAENLRAVRELVAIGVRRDLWLRLLTLSEAALADYKTKFRDPPASMTMHDILAKAARPIEATRKPQPGNVLQVLLAD